MKTFAAAAIALFILVATSCEPPQQRVRKLIKDGINYKHQGAYPEAQECFEKAIKIMPENAEGYYHLANLNVTVRNFDLALEQFNKTIELDSLHGEAYLNRGRVVFVLTGDRQKACPDWIKAHNLGVPSLTDEIKHCAGVVLY
jgi:tetratricopeptide (TPR) repeat protein